jgi:sugar phosphate isomerase/epimerase
VHRLVLAHLTAVGLTPPQLIRLASDTGCEGLALIAAPAAVDLGGSIHRIDDNPALRRETGQALAETGVTIDVVDGLGLMPDFSLARAETIIDVFGELGTRHYNTVFFDPDENRGRENLHALVEAVEQRRARLSIEFLRLGGSPVASLKDAVALATSRDFAGRLTITVDTLHLARAEETPADVAAIDPALIGLAQICDGKPGWPGDEAYFHEAIFERGIPGEGELPLDEFLRVIPRDFIVSPEVPVKSLRDAGVPVEEVTRRVVDASRRLMARAAAEAA